MSDKELNGGGYTVVPVITTCTSKLAMPLIVDDTLSVITACTDCPWFRVAPSLFHVILIGPLASGGSQLVFVILSSSCLSHVFLM